MTSLHALCQFLEHFAPADLAEDWDNVGLLVDRTSDALHRVMTCLTLTPASVAEAVRRKAELVIVHHPLPFRPLKRLTRDTIAGRLLLDLVRHEVAVYSPHTSFDSATRGINQRLAEGLGLEAIQPLVPSLKHPDGPGSGRRGVCPAEPSLAEFAARARQFLQITSVGVVGSETPRVQRVAVACGSAGQFLPIAYAAGCDSLVLGETNFHTCLEAEALGVRLLLLGHYASERFALEMLAAQLRQEFPQLEVWASEDEADPIRWL